MLQHILNRYYAAAEAFLNRWLGRRIAKKCARLLGRCLDALLGFVVGLVIAPYVLARRMFEDDEDEDD